MSLKNPYLRFASRFSLLFGWLFLLASTAVAVAGLWLRFGYASSHSTPIMQTLLQSNEFMLIWLIFCVALSLLGLLLLLTATRWMTDAEVARREATTEIPAAHSPAVLAAVAD